MTASAMAKRRWAKVKKSDRAAYARMMVAAREAKRHALKAKAV